MDMANVTMMMKMKKMTSSNVARNVTPPDTPFTDGAVVISAILLCAMFVFGLFANTLTIFVIARSKKLKSIFNIVIISLCFSDLFSALVSPLSLYRLTWGYDEWGIPGVFCKIFWATDICTTYVTVLHILAFAILRLLSIKWPSLYQRITFINVKAVVTSAWIFVFFIAFVPIFIMFEVRVLDRYSNTVDANWPSCTLNVERLDAFRIYHRITFFLFILCPMIAIIVLSSAIVIILKNRKIKRGSRRCNIHSSSSEESDYEKITQKKEARAIIQLGFIISSFLLGYVPITVYAIYMTNIDDYSSESTWQFGMAAYSFLRLSECLNPIFYNLASSKMRKETLNFVRSLKSACRCKGETSYHSGSYHSGRTTNMKAVI